MWIASPEDPMRKVAGRLMIAAGVLVLLGALALLGLYQAARGVPEFYKQALAAPPMVHYDGGDRFEQHALELHNQLHHSGRWEVRFTQDEINGWLAVDLPAKFPQVLPPGVSEPRIAIEGGVVHMALQYQSSGVETVVSLSGQAHLTDQVNEVAIHITKARAGLLPVPLTNFLREITERAARANIPLRWTESDGSPVALVRVPLDLDDDCRRQLVVERLDFGDREFVVAGRTEERSLNSSDQAPPDTAAQPAESETRQR